MCAETGKTGLTISRCRKKSANLILALVLPPTSTSNIRLAEEKLFKNPYSFFAILRVHGVWAEGVDMKKQSASRGSAAGRRANIQENSPNKVAPGLRKNKSLSFPRAISLRGGDSIGGRTRRSDGSPASLSEATRGSAHTKVDLSLTLDAGIIEVQHREASHAADLEW